MRRRFFDYYYQGLMSSNMRIVYLHQYFNVPSDSGGTRSYEFARRMVGRGHEVHVLTSDRQGLQSQSIWTQREVAGIYVHRIGVPYDNNMSFYRRIWAFIVFALRAARRSRAVNPDVIFATSTPLTIFIPAYFASLFRRTPIVFEIRDSWPTVPIELGYLRNPFLIGLARLLERFAYCRARHIIALSPGMADDARRHGARKKPITVIPNSADIDLFTVPSSVGKTWRSKNDIPADALLVVYTGTFGRANGVDYLVDLASEVAKQLPNVVFALIGGGSEKKDVTAKAKAANLLGSTVRILPTVAKNEVPSVLSAATVSTSIVTNNRVMENNSANKFFDSLAAGRPIAINHGGWQADLIQKHKLGVVLNAGSIERDSAVLVSLLSDQEKLAQSSRNAHELAGESFARDALATELIEILEAVGRK